MDMAAPLARQFGRENGAGQITASLLYSRRRVEHQVARALRVDRRRNSVLLNFIDEDLQETALQLPVSTRDVMRDWQEALRRLAQPSIEAQRHQP